MTYLLDTSVIIALLRDDPSVVQFISGHQHDVLLTSSICAFELYSGVYRLSDEQKKKKANDQVTRVLGSFSEVRSFDPAQGEIAGKIWADLAGRGKKIDDIDVLIAAAAFSVRATLVTRNSRHFSRVTGLPVEAV